MFLEISTAFVSFCIGNHKTEAEGNDERKEEEKTFHLLISLTTASSLPITLSYLKLLGELVQPCDWVKVFDHLKLGYSFYVIMSFIAIFDFCRIYCLVIIIIILSKYSVECFLYSNNFFPLINHQKNYQSNW